MKKRAGFALLLLLSLTLSGCGGDVKETETETVSPPTGQMELELDVQSLRGENIETEAQPEKGTEETENAPGDGREHTVIGSLADIDMEQITVLSDNGNEIIFSTKGAELDFAGGFRVGNLVSVSYKGELTQTDNRKTSVTVLRAADSGDIRELEASAPETEQETGNTEESKETETETGGETKADEPETTETDTAEADGTDSGTEGEAAAAEDARVLTGKLDSMDRNSMTIVTADGGKKTFGIVNVRMHFAAGMAKGTEVAISYTGELTEAGETVLSVDSTEKKGE